MALVNILSFRDRSSRRPRRIEVEEVAPRALVEAVGASYPGLTLGTGLLRFVLHALLTPHRAGAAVPVPNGLLAAVFGQGHLHRQHRFPSRRSIQALADALDAPAAGAEPADVVLYGFNYRASESYAVELRGLPAGVVRLAQEAREIPADGRITLEGWVYVGPSGRTRALDHDMAAVRKEMEESLRPPDGAAALTQRLQGYLNGINASVFKPLRNAISAPETGAFVREEFPDGRRRGIVLSTLRAVLRQPVPIYQTSERTPRIHAVRQNATGLPSSLRQHLTERLGWVELDLAHAQLACNARAWEVEGALTVLAAEDYVLWDDLMGHLGADPHSLAERRPALYRALKGVLKPTVHGVSFGMTEWKVKRFGLAMGDPDEAEVAAILREATGRPLGEAGELLLSHRVVGAMLEAREGQRRALYQEGGRTDALGTAWDLKKRGDWKRVLARCSQAHEMKLLEPVIDDALAQQAKRRPRYRIVLWQHDGFTVSPKGRGEAERGEVARRLVDLVEGRAREMGVPTRLKVVGPALG